MSAQLDAVILTTLPSIILLLCSSQYSPGSGSFLLLLFFDHHFHFPAQLVGGFALSDLLDKPVVTGVVPSPRYVPSIFIAHRVVTVYRLPIRLPAKSALTWPVV